MDRVKRLAVLLKIRDGSQEALRSAVKKGEISELETKITAQRMRTNVIQVMARGSNGVLRKKFCSPQLFRTGSVSGI